MRRSRAIALLSVAMTQVYAQAGVATLYDNFRKKYRHDLAGFALDCIEWHDDEPAKYQLKAWTLLVEKGRLAARAPHGAGKSMLAAITVHWFALTRDIDSDWKVITTASAWRQLTKYLWPEIHKWAHRIKWDVVGRRPYSGRDELFTLSLKMGTGEAFAAASSRPEFMEGAHADSILYVFDESKAIPDETFDAAEGAFSTASSNGDSQADIEPDDIETYKAWKHAREAYALAISTPGEPIGRFYDIQSSKQGYSDWHALHITLEDAIESGRITRKWAESRAEQWGKDSAVFKNRVLGEFASSDEDTVIPLEWIEAAMQRHNEWLERRREMIERGTIGDEARLIADCIGCDVAREGTDKTAFALRTGSIVTEIRVFAREDTMVTTGRAVGFLTGNTVGHQQPNIIVDVIGIGAGVVDRLRELGFQVGAFNASGKSYDRDRSNELGFANKRAEAWWQFRELLEPSFGSDVAIPDDDDLLAELITPKWKVTSGGNILIESKDDIKKRLNGRSTDRADAVIQTFAKVPVFADISEGLREMAEDMEELSA